MIGVISSKEEQIIVGEFFELFKIPWEFYKQDRKNYDVVIVSDSNIPNNAAPLVIVYSTEKIIDSILSVAESAIESSDKYVTWGDTLLPVYGSVLNFFNVYSPILVGNRSGKPVGYEIHNEKQRIIRVGYDLFYEVEYLLASGQPSENSLSPTLDIHIAMLRKWIIESGITLMEIPPIPAGYNTIVSLTHDVDFIGLKKHLIDHSVLGFIYRATIGSLIEFLKKRIAFTKLCKNIKATCSLPFVYMSICSDPWDQFDNYLRLERGLPSTFFVIPYKNRAGAGFLSKKDKYRAAKYDVDDMVPVIKKLKKHGCEAGVHGIDAWHSVKMGKNELDRVSSVSGQKDIGIRMHWLCQNKSTYKILDQAGYLYDSSFGYNDAVGFRSGTAQVYKPFDTVRLLELPMHIQDSALFNRGRMNITNSEAIRLCDKIIESVDTYKGVLTILWHQRSLGPERLWGDIYSMLIEKLKRKNAWFATAGDVTAWFRKRRMARFMPDGEVDVPECLKEDNSTPPLILRKYVYKNQDSNKSIESKLKQSDFELLDRIILQD